MSDINLWECNLKDQFIFFKNIHDFFEYLDSNNSLSNSFVVKDEFNASNDEAENLLDNSCVKSEVNVTYTNQEYPIAISKNEFYPSFINSSFFSEHKEELKEYYKKKIISILDTSRSLNVPDFILDDELCLKIAGKPDLSCHIKQTIKDGKIAEEILNRLKNSHIDIDYKLRNGETLKISSPYAFGYVKFGDLKTTKELILDLSTIKNMNYDSLLYLNDEAIIKIQAPYNMDISMENDYFLQVSNFIDKISAHNKKYSVKISVSNRELFRKSGIVDKLSGNVNLIINSDSYDYNLSDYMKEETILENLAKPIRDSSLSPFEKYIAVYNIVKNFKPYKENKNNKIESRYLRYILDKNSEYMVCVGYASLLSELLNRVGINNMDLSASVDISLDSKDLSDEKTKDLYDSSKGEDKINYEGHARNIVRIDDDKYNIHGIYVVDSTWDNYVGWDRYLNALLTFDRKREARRMERLSNTDLLLDFHNLDEFYEKINLLFKHEISKIRMQKKGKIDDHDLINMYRTIFYNILKILSKLDYSLYNDLKDKYQNKMYSSSSLEEFESVVSEILSEYAKKIIPLSNQNVSMDTIYKAARVTRKEISKWDDAKMAKWDELAILDNNIASEVAFPYQYDSNEKREGYLEVKSGGRGR